MREVWVDITGFEDEYQISSLGRVRTLTHTIYRRNGSPYFVKGKIRKVIPDRWGYLTVLLYRNNKPTGKRVNRLVAEAFIPNPANKPEVNHKDGVKANNQIGNLEWATPVENGLHAASNGLCSRKLEQPEVRAIKRKLGEGQTIASLAREFKVSESIIRWIKKGRWWRHVQ